MNVLHLNHRFVVSIDQEQKEGRKEAGDCIRALERTSQAAMRLMTTERATESDNRSRTIIRSTMTMTTRSKTSKRSPPVCAQLERDAL